MFTIEQATSLAPLVTKDAPSYLANFKGEDGEDFDGTKFLETFKSDLQKVRKTERDNQLMRGRKENGAAVLSKLKGLNPKFEYEGNDAAEAVEAYHNSLQGRITELSNQKPTGVTVDGLTREEILKLPEFQDTWKEYAATNDGKLKAALERAADAEKSFEAKTQELILKTRGSRIRANVIQWANQAGVNLADPVKQKDLYKNQVDMLLSVEAFKAHNWAEEGDELVPITGDGQRRKDDNFHDMTGVDLVKMLNPFGFKKFDSTNSSPSATSRSGGSSKMNYETYMKRRAALQEDGDRNGMALLAKEFEAGNK